MINSKYEHFFYFDFTQELTDNSQIKCPECKEWSLATEWKHIPVYCNVCGDHPGILCPKCDELFDHVWDDEEFKVK